MKWKWMYICGKDWEFISLSEIQQAPGGMRRALRTLPLYHDFAPCD